MTNADTELSAKIPDCPCCGEDELYYNYASNGGLFRLGCYLCGYDSGWRCQYESMGLSGSIAKIVAEKKEKEANR